jgi:hypothetical protein
VTRTSAVRQALLLTVLAVVAAWAYIGVAQLQLLRYRIVAYGITWVVIAGLVLLRVEVPRPGGVLDRRALAIAVGYTGLLALVGGIVVLTPAAGYDVRLALLAPYWGPAPIITTPVLSVFLFPARVLGYITLGVLVYVLAVDTLQSAAVGVIGLFSCISCTWPIVASLLTGLVGSTGALAVLASTYAFDLSTLVYVVTVALLSYRPLIRSG